MTDQGVVELTKLEAVYDVRSMCLEGRDPCKRIDDDVLCCGVGLFVH